MSSHSSVASVSPPPQKFTKKLHQYGSKEVAQELAVMDAELLRKIAPEELQNGAWMKKDKKYDLAPNVMAMVGSFNRLALMVPTEILEEKTHHARAKIITAFISIASKCHRLQNYNSLKAVLAGLQCTPIFRLKKTWKEVPSKRKKRFNQLTALMAEENNWTAYREEFQHKVVSNSPCIPFLGVFLTTVALSQEADSLLEDKGAIERRRSSSFYETYHILEAITVRNKLKKLRSQASGQVDDEDILSPSTPNAPSDSDNEDSEKDSSPSSSTPSLPQSTSPDLNSLTSTSTYHTPVSSLSQLNKDLSTTSTTSVGSISPPPLVNGSVRHFQTPPPSQTDKISIQTSSDISLDDGSRLYQGAARPSSADSNRLSVSSPRRRSSLTQPPSRSSTKRPSLVRDLTISGSLECLLDAVNAEDDTIGWENGLLKSSSLQSIGPLDIDIPFLNGSEIELDDIHIDTGGPDPKETLKPSSKVVPNANNRENCLVAIKHKSLQDVLKNSHSDHSFVHTNNHTHQNGGHSSAQISHVKKSKPRSNTDVTPSSPSSLNQNQTHNHNPLISLPILHPRRPSFSPRVGKFLKHTVSVPSINFHRDRRGTPDVPQMRAIQLEKSTKPVDMLQQYQFISLSFGGTESNLELRRLILEGLHNTEGQNYKLSYEREPN